MRITLGNQQSCSRHLNRNKTLERLTVIDPEELKGAMREALRQALETIGIDNPVKPPLMSKSIEKYRRIEEQCGAKHEYVATPKNVTLANLNEDDYRFS